MFCQKLLSAKYLFSCAAIVRDLLNCRCVCESRWIQKQCKCTCELSTGLKGMEQPSLESLGYHFDENGVMRDKNGKRYVFLDQDSYDVIGLSVTEEIYRLMENPPYSMKRQYLDEANKARSAFIYLSKDWDQKEHLVVLIHGSGVVRAGQWGRRLIMNESLNMGSQLPYLRMCQIRDWGVVVMNTNMNVRRHNGTLVSLPDSSSPAEHGLTVWKRYVAKAKARSVAVVAHSAGGAVISGIMENCWRTEWRGNLKCVCLTDAMFTLESADTMDGLPKIQNWLASTHAEVGVPLDSGTSFGNRPYVNCVSAGTSKHDETSASAMEDIFQFIECSFQ